MKNVWETQFLYIMRATHNDNMGDMAYNIANINAYEPLFVILIF